MKYIYLKKKSFLKTFWCFKKVNPRWGIITMSNCIHLHPAGWHACSVCAGQVAELLQYPDGAAGASTAHDLQGKHEASSATWRADLHQLSPCYFWLHVFFLFPTCSSLCFAFIPLSHPPPCDIPPPINTLAECTHNRKLMNTSRYMQTYTQTLL